ncbi:MAG: sensor histidine kinase [Acetatifactor sp.]|nr:sensor histidine kinase [Acetatifactor sp.]
MKQAQIIIISIVLIWALTSIILLRLQAKRIRGQAMQLAADEKKLAEAEQERLRANLLRAISHDLRTPLTGIIGNSLAYLENTDYLPSDEKDELVRNIYEDSNWLLHMVENLLTITHIRNQDMDIVTTEESLEEVVAESVQKFGSRHPDSQINVSIPEEFLMIPMDAILIEQVLINLCENAYYHSDSTEPIDLTVSHENDKVIFTVKDYGKGIPADKLNHLFDGAGDQISSDIYKGMGIGLAICKTIITAHHGTITGGNHDHGAVFTFTLPKNKEHYAKQDQCTLN